jgi:hypothetical protein
MLTGGCARKRTMNNSSCQYSSTYKLWCWVESTAHVMRIILVDKRTMPHQALFWISCHLLSMMFRRVNGSTLEDHCHDSSYFISNLPVNATALTPFDVERSQHYIWQPLAWDDQPTLISKSNYPVHATILTPPFRVEMRQRQMMWQAVV